MSKIICASAIDGAVSWVARADAILGEAVRQKGDDFPVSFPDTAYYLPVIYALTGEKAKSLADLKHVLKRAKTLLPENRSINSTAPTVFYCGDDLASKQTVAGLIRDCGFDAVDTGPLRNARYLEPMAMVLIQAMVAGSIPPDAAFHILRR